MEPDGVVDGSRDYHLVVVHPHTPLLGTEIHSLESWMANFLLEKRSELLDQNPWLHPWLQDVDRQTQVDDTMVHGQIDRARHGVGVALGVGSRVHAEVLVVEQWVPSVPVHHGWIGVTY